jgi:hypothetical protein
MLLEFSVKNQLLGMKRLSPIVSDTINYFEAEFTFLTTDWADCVKTAHFTDGTTVYDQVLVDDAIPTTAGLNFAAGTWTVYVHGNSTAYRLTTNSVTFTVDASGVIDGEPLPEVSLTFEEQLLLAWQESPYDLAVAAGYEGTVEQWLATLVGAAGAGAHIHIKYSAISPTQNSDMTDTPSAYIGIYSGTSVTAPTAYTSYTWYLWSGGSSVSHNDTTSKQGGTTGQYYHLTSAQHTVVGNTSGTNTGDETPSDANPAMNSTAAPGTSDNYSRADHVHPSDTSKAGTAVASTSANGLSPQATAPAAGLRNVLAIDNAETSHSDKPLFDATVPSTQASSDAAATGSATVAARRDHKHAMPAIQAPATITENTDAAPALGTIANNTEYRCTHGTPTDAPSMTIASIAANTTEFACNVIYKAKAAAPSAPAVTNNSGKTTTYMGDNVSAGTFSPVAGRVYRMGWVWDGLILECHIKGIA